MESLPAYAREDHTRRNPLRATVTADGPIKLEGMFEVGTSIIDPPSSTASELSDLIAKVQEARLHAKQEAISQPRQSASVTGVANKSGDAHVSAFDHAGFKRLTRAQPTASAIATAGPKIISVQEGRRILRSRSIQATRER